MSLRFLIDAQSPPALAQHLQSLGHFAEHINDIGLGDGSDREIWAHAGTYGAALVTKDQDFADLTRRRPAPTAVVWIRLGNTTNEALWRTLAPMLPEIVDAISRGETRIEIA